MEWPLSPDNLGPESVNHLGVMEMVKKTVPIQGGPIGT